MDSRIRRAAFVALALAGSLAACLLADPPAGIPARPVQRPEIDRTAVVPAVTQVLETWPSQFYLPVDAFDPAVRIAYQAFIDYSVLHGQATSEGFLDSDPSLDASFRSFTVILEQPTDLTACHTIEIMVARSFVDTHRPDSYGGDSVVWFYAPSGSLDSCPVFDAGVDAEAGSADALAETSEGGGD
jgi:hypothetical protein